MLRGSYHPCLRHLSPSTVSASNSVSAGGCRLWELAPRKHTPLPILMSGALRKGWIQNSLQEVWNGPTLSAFLILENILHQVSYKYLQYKSTWKLCCVTRFAANYVLIVPIPDLLKLLISHESYFMFNLQNRLFHFLILKRTSFSKWIRGYSTVEYQGQAGYFPKPNLLSKCGAGWSSETNRASST